MPLTDNDQAPAPDLLDEDAPPASAPIKRADRWTAALEAARACDASRARHICADIAAERPPFRGAHEYLLGRCLAEAETSVDEAVELLRRARQANSKNIAIPHALALALMRAGNPAEAAELFKAKRLPHDLSLLAQTMLTMESAIRPWPAAPPEGWPLLPSPLAPGAPPPKRAELNWRGRRRLGAALDRMERGFFDRRHVDAIKVADELLADGIEDNELHLIAGLVCEEAGDGLRARAHLARAQDLEPKNLLARTALARVYWRNGWLDLAEDLLRSVPIEGPDDYGRHYHLALVHDAAGRRLDALAAMRIALADFFIETREFNIERAYGRWTKEIGARDEGLGIRDET